MRRAVQIIDAISPRWWVLENVHGATRAIGSILGPPVAVYGSFYLWGVFPPFEAHLERDKTKKSGRRRAERRAAIPWALSEGLAVACERLAAQLPPGDRPPGPQPAPSCPPAPPELAPLEPRNGFSSEDFRPLERALDTGMPLFPRRVPCPGAHRMNCPHCGGAPPGHEIHCSELDRSLRATQEQKVLLAVDLVRLLAECRHERINEQQELTWCQDCGAIQFPEAQGWVVPRWLVAAKELQK